MNPLEALKSPEPLRVSSQWVGLGIRSIAQDGDRDNGLITITMTSGASVDVWSQAVCDGYEHLYGPVMSIGL